MLMFRETREVPRLVPAPGSRLLFADEGSGVFGS